MEKPKLPKFEFHKMVPFEATSEFLNFLISHISYCLLFHVKMSVKKN